MSYIPIILLVAVILAIVVGQICWHFMSHEERMEASWVYRTATKARRELAELRRGWRKP